MSQFVEGNTKSFVAGEAIAVNRRVAVNSAGKVLLAGATSVATGVAITPSFADGDDVAVSLRTASGTQKMVASEAITRGASVFGAAAGKVAATGSVFVGTALEAATADDDVIEVLPGPNTDILANSGVVQHLRARVTAAQINGAGGHTLLAAVPGRSYRLVDASMISIGGAAGGATAVRIVGTQAASAVALVSNTVGALTQNTRVLAGITTNSSILTAGASFVANDANTAITIDRTVSNLTGSTDIDVLLSYVLA
jgi:hypothetical protein